PRNNDIAAHPADDLQEFRPGIRYGAEPHQLVERQLVLAELADGEDRTVERQRRRDDVDARTVRQAGIADRARFIDAASHLTHDALADVEKLLVVAETNARFLQQAIHFDIGAARTVHHDIGNIIAGKKRL